MVAMESTGAISLSTSSDGLTIDYGTTANNYTGSLLAINTWYHVAMSVRNTSTTNHYIRGYLNGQLNATGTDTSTFAAITSMTLGNYAGGGNVNPLNGNIRDFRFWNRALNDKEVMQEFNSLVPFNKAGLLAWSPLDDDLFTDKSGHGYIWTTTGAVALQNGGPRCAWPGRGMQFIR
jgi:hypothetical protein